MSGDHILVKLDFHNAFNSVRRDAVLESMVSSAPEIYNYVYSSYHGSSALGFGDHVVMSSEGIQQGDPLRPLLFCAAVQPLLTGCNSELRIGYLDDFTIGGKSDQAVLDVERINSYSA